MADFTCEPGKVLSPDEVADYTTYRNLGIAPPDGYADVVQEVQDGKGLVLRCKTEDEKKADEEAHAASLAASQEVADREKRIRTEALKRVNPDMGIATEAINLGPSAAGRAATTRATGEALANATPVADSGAKKSDK